MTKGFDKAYWEKKRKFTRHKPEMTAIAEIDLREYGEDFEPDMKGLVFSESHGGVGIVLLANDLIEHGMCVRMKVGDLGPLGAQVVWRKDVDSEVIMVGFKYLE